MKTRRLLENTTFERLRAGFDSEFLFQEAYLTGEFAGTCQETIALSFEMSCHYLCSMAVNFTKEFKSSGMFECVHDEAHPDAFDELNSRAKSAGVDLPDSCLRMIKLARVCLVH